MLPADLRLRVTNQLFQLKKDKGLLERRLEDLERENIHMRAAEQGRRTATTRPTDANGTDDFEPVRSVLNSTECQARLESRGPPAQEHHR